jgi:hypothetical protein
LSDLSVSTTEDYIKATTKKILDEVSKDVLTEPDTSSKPLENYIGKPKIIMVEYFMN